MAGNGAVITIKRQLFGAELFCTATPLDEGLHVLLTGGHKSHIGAISTAGPGEPAHTKGFPGHKDQYISAPWAERLADRRKQRVCVVCGIHYDDATKEQIGEILHVTEEMLEELLSRLTNETDCP